MTHTNPPSLTVLHALVDKQGERLRAYARARESLRKVADALDAEAARAEHHALPRTDPAWLRARAKELRG